MPHFLKGKYSHVSPRFEHILVAAFGNDVVFVDTLAGKRTAKVVILHCM